MVISGGVSPDESTGDELTVEMVLLAGQNNSLPEFRDLAGPVGMWSNVVQRKDPTLGPDPRTTRLGDRAGQSQDPIPRRHQP